MARKKIPTTIYGRGVKEDERKDLVILGLFSPMGKADTSQYVFAYHPKGFTTKGKTYNWTVYLWLVKENKVHPNVNWWMDDEFTAYRDFMEKVVKEAGFHFRNYKLMREIHG